MLTYSDANSWTLKIYMQNELVETLFRNKYPNLYSGYFAQRNFVHFPSFVVIQETKTISFTKNCGIFQE